MSALGIFAKPPRPGLVKTRLGADIGADKAAMIYRYCLEHTLAVAQDSGLDYRVFLSEPSDDECFQDEVYTLQRGADLGTRMHNALQSLSRDSEHGAILIGSDCIDLSPRHMLDAARALGGHELVLSPARDGGYALIGCSQPRPELFSGIDWSTQRVLQQTLDKARALDIRVCLLETVRDIDTLADVENYPELLALVASS